MQSSSTFIKVPRPLPEVEITCIDLRLGKYYCILESIRAELGVNEQVLFVSNTIGESGGTE